MFKLKAKTSEAAALPIPKPIPMRRKSSIAGVDFEGMTVHIAQGAGGRITQVADVTLEVPPDKLEDAKVMGAALKSALDKARVRIKEVVFALPRGPVVLRPLQVPMVGDVRELASVVNFQIAKDLPFRVEDAVVDFKVLRAIDLARPAGGENLPEPERKLELLVGAVKKDVVEFYRTVAREAGLKIEALGLRPLGNARFVQREQTADANAPVMVVALRTDEITIDVIEGEKLVFSKVAAVAFPETEEGRTSFGQALQIEVVRGLHSYGGPVSKISVLGGTGFEQPVAQTLSSKLGLAVDVPGAGSDNGEPRAAAASGLALGAMDPAGLLLDFENPKRPPVQRNTKRTTTLAAIAAGIVLLFTLLGVRMNLVKKRLAIKQQVQIELTDAEKKLPIYRRLKSQHRVVNGWLAEEQNWLDHLAYLSAVLPGADQIYVSAFTTTPQHVIRFSVQAKTGELLAELDKRLRSAGYEVKPLSITPANDKHGYHFRTTVELTIPKKMKPDLAKVKAPARPADDSPPQAEVKTASAGRRRP